MTPQEDRLILFPKKTKHGKHLHIRSTISDKHLFWLAGILEGEGSFMAGPPSNPNGTRIACQMADEDVIVRIAWLFGVSPSPIRKVAKAHHKPTYVAAVNGCYARELMAKLRPLMSSRRQAQIDRAIASYNPVTEYASRVNRRIISDDQIEVMRERSKNGESLRKIAADYGVHHETIRLRIHIRYPFTYRKDQRFIFESAEVSW